MSELQKKKGNPFVTILAGSAIACVVLAAVLSVAGVVINNVWETVGALSDILKYGNFYYLTDDLNNTVSTIMQNMPLVGAGLLLPVSLLLINGDGKKKNVGIVFAVAAGVFLAAQLLGIVLGSFCTLLAMAGSNDWLLRCVNIVFNGIPGTQVFYQFMLAFYYMIKGYDWATQVLFTAPIYSVSHLLYVASNALCLVGFVLSIFSGKKKAEKAE